jgi:hypothetical protein
MTASRRHGAFMEPSSGNRWQAVARWVLLEDSSNRPIVNLWQSTATVPERMVRRGSTVRVRQRALQRQRFDRW